jgi:hypothetical protein
LFDSSHHHLGRLGARRRRQAGGLTKHRGARWRNCSALRAAPLPPLSPACRPCPLREDPPYRPCSLTPLIAQVGPKHNAQTHHTKSARHASRRHGRRRSRVRVSRPLTSQICQDQDLPLDDLGDGLWYRPLHQLDRHISAGRPLAAQPRLPLAALEYRVSGFRV